MRQFTRGGIVIFIFRIAVMWAIQSCTKDLDDLSPGETILPFNQLSEYQIYQGNPADLIPDHEYVRYEIRSQLFTDYAEKQRLIKLPTGTKMEAVDNGLFHFPEGTVLAKTFYYFKDKRNPPLGKKLVETRVLQKLNGKWVAGTYKWNSTQTDATLVTTCVNQTVNWIDGAGDERVISYHVPTNTECKTCHNSSKAIIPIGPKVRNLNFDVVRHGIQINQLTFLLNKGILNTPDQTTFGTLPNYNDTSTPLNERGRAYLDINCAHCHSDDGFASEIRYRLSYETDTGVSKVKEGKAVIDSVLRTGRMPKIGTTVIDKEGLDLIKKYLETL